MIETQSRLSEKTKIESYLGNNGPDDPSQITFHPLDHAREVAHVSVGSDLLEYVKGLLHRSAKNCGHQIT